MRRLNQLRMRRRTDWLLAVLDALTVIVVIWGVDRMLHRAMTPARIWSVAIVCGALLGARTGGLYRRRALRPGAHLAGPALSTAGGAAAIAGLAVLTSPPGPGVAWPALIFAGVSGALVLSRATLSRCRRALVPFGVALETYAVLGEAPAMKRLVADLTRASGAPFVIAGCVPEGLTPAQTAARVAEMRVDGLLVPPHLDAAAVGGLARSLAGHDVDVLVAPLAFDLDAQVTSVTHLQGIPLLRLGGAVPSRRAVRTAARDRRSAGLAILGTRGIPANYGGFETFAEQLALRFVGDGTYLSPSMAAVISPPRARSGEGSSSSTLPTIKSKYLDTVVHTVLSALHLVLTGGPRDVLLCNAANAPVVPFLRLCGRRVVLNVDGLEWRRGKWGVLGRSWYRMGEWLSVRFASVLVTDAEEVRTYYRVRHDTDSVMVPYGAEQLGRGAVPMPAEAPIEPDSFVLYVSRWERENNPLLVARAHAATASGLGPRAARQRRRTTRSWSARCMPRPARTQSCLAPSMATAIEGCSPTPAAMCTRRRSVARTQHWSRPWARATSASSWTPRRTARSPGTWRGTGPTRPSWCCLLERAAGLAAAALEHARETTREWAGSRYSWSAVAAQYDALIFGGASPETAQASSPAASAPTTSR